MNTLRSAEKFLRKYDRAIRLRYAMEYPNTILIERKTRRGRIGAMLPDGLEPTPDAGYRMEWGHVAVASVRSSNFCAFSLLEALKAADTWKKWDRNAQPHWKGVEDREAQEKSRKKAARLDGLRYKSSELFDRYCWRYGARVSVPTKIS